ncbi:MAG: hypothetical protein LUI04_00170 [Porphyromonadaceae bacterium]|nr:hypothetical protein [Porphyromonadaceae bacterium]
MKANRFTRWMMLAAVGCLAVSCNDQWDDHFDAHEILSDEVEIYEGDVVSYMKEHSTLSEITELFQQTGILETIVPEEEYTLVLCDNDHLDMSAISNDTAFVKNSYSDISFSPSKLTNNFGIRTMYETYYDKKMLRVYEREDGLYIDEYKLAQQVKAANGYVYVIEGTIKPRESIYEYLQSLGDDYSLFKAYVAEYEESYFDAESSVADGVNDMGNTTYSDSVISVRNTLMDRYTQTGLDYWNMRSENYTSTMFVPSNQLIEKALNNAYTNLPIWLNRAVTASDSLKFKEWIVQACFSDQRLSPDEVGPGGNDFYCVGGYTRSVDESTDTETFSVSDSAYWRPSVQLVDFTKTDTVSNGVVYYLSDFKIPNHIVIYRLKTRFYEIWSAMTSAQQDQYFRWTNWVDPMIVNDAQSEFTLSETLPTIYYHVLTAEPSMDAILAATAVDSLTKSQDLQESAQTLLDSLRTVVSPDSTVLAQIDSLNLSIDSLSTVIREQKLFAENVTEDDYYCRVDYDGLLYNSDDKDYGLVECNIPAGEYYLRMGFKHSLTYSLSIYFNDECLIKDMSMAAQGSNYHFDRGGASDMEFFGVLSACYPEGFDFQAWYELDEKSVAYDTDGYQVAIVNIPEDGNFHITIESSDQASIYVPGTTRNKNNVAQLMMYHWCLRPTKNNY